MCFIDNYIFAIYIYYISIYTLYVNNYMYKIIYTYTYI